MEKSNTIEGPTLVNVIPMDAIKASERLRNPQHKARVRSPKEGSCGAGQQDPYNEERVSPDQPSFREVNVVTPDTNVKGG